VRTGVPTVSLASSRLVAEAIASVNASAACYRLAEDIGFVAIAVTELKFVQVERQVLPADVMIGADDPTLQQAPKAFQVIRVYLAAHVLAATMCDCLMRERLRSGTEQPIACMFVGCNQSDPLADRFAHKAVHRRHVGRFNQFAHDATLPADRADYGWFVPAATPLFSALLWRLYHFPPM
jgi:hypothetical protein